MSNRNRATFLVLACAWLAACGPSKEERRQAERLHLLEDVTDEYYVGGVDAGARENWQVISTALGTSAGSHSSIEIVVDVPRKQAKNIMALTAEKQLKIVGSIACPPRSHSLWQEFTDKDYLTLQASVDGKVFIDVNCRRWRSD